LLASRPSISGQEYFGVLQRTACGQRIAAGLGPIAAGRNFHPYLSKDQVVLLKSAVAISSMDPDLAAGRRVIAKAAYVAGEIISAQIPSKDQDLRNLVGIPFFALSRGVLTDPGVFASKSSDQLTRLDRRIADEFEIHASSLSYYLGVTGPFYDEGEAKLKMNADLRKLAAPTASKGRTISFAYSLSHDAAALTLLDLNSDTVVPFDRLLSVDRQSLKDFDSLVLLIDKGDILESNYSQVIRLIKETSPAPMAPGEDKRLVDRREQIGGLLELNQTDALTVVKRIFQNIRDVPAPLDSRLSTFVKWGRQGDDARGS